MKPGKNEIELILKTELFRGSTESVLLKLLAASDCEACEYERGQTIYNKNAFKHSLGIVLKGRVKVTKDSADGRTIMMNTLRAGDIFGAAALYNNVSEYVVTLTALDQVKAVFFSQRLVGKLIERDPLISENYIRYLSSRIIFLNRKIYFLTAGTAEQRLASFVMDNFSEGDAQSLPMPMNKLASMLNMSRASIYRGLDILTACGAVSYDNKKMCIININKLKEVLNREDQKQ